ncbi:MAG: RNA polymerase sigma factor [Dokdonia sp.]|jgi:RNA polymerase sigma-70 factor (ECF subfamily)|tara:strand:+ start:163 stop:729 length:567 start_codon:yes stop_codon:yes gene_type:complete
MRIIQFNNEKQLIKKSVEGHRDAQRRLYELHAPKMLSVCRYYVKDVHQAEEAMCNGFLKVFKHLASFKHQGSFEGWIRRIMVRESISYLRSLKKLHFTEEGILEGGQTTNMADPDLDVAHLQLLIDSLPEGYRAVFVMYAIEGYKHQEIAKTLGISESTSKSQLFKARKLLQSKLQSLNTLHHGTSEV